MSPTPPEAQAIESRKVQTLLKIRIEAPMSNISIQMIVFISYFGLSIRLRGHPASFFGFSAGRLAGDMALMAMSLLLLK